MNPTGKAATRRDLLYLLAQASELEHSLACQYLFTAFSLKQRPDEGVTAAQLTKIRRWRQQMIDIAIEEMLHLALASNLLTAIGGAPYFRRANFPQAKTYTSLSLRFVLAPFSEQTIKRYICFELPQDFEPTDGENDWNEICAELKTSAEALLLLPEPLLPKRLEYHMIGELYELIRQGFVLSPLGDAVTQLPAGEDRYPGRTAGPSFEIFSDVQLLPHLNSAWLYFRERLEEISAACDFLRNDTSTEPFPRLRNTLLNVSAALKKIAYPISFEPNGLTWLNGISQLFSPIDVDHMKRRLIPLDDYEFVKNNASLIHDTVKDGFMPKAPLGAWTSKRVEFFKQWMDNGFPE